MKTTRHTTMSDHTCSCAKCQCIEPWASRFAQCIQVGWIIASQAVEDGTASDVSPGASHDGMRPRLIIEDTEE